MITEFISSFTEELSKPSRFKVIFNPVSVNSQLSKILDAKTLALRCETASLPGRSIATADMRIYGPTEKFPYQSVYDDISLTFICTDSMAEKKFFNQWMEIINPENNWNINYKKNYVMDIEIDQYDNSDTVTHSIKLVDAFPINVNELALDWSTTDTYHKLSVTFAYTYWTKMSQSNGYEPELLDPTNSLGGQTFSNIPSLLSSGADTQTIGTFLDVTNQSIGPFDSIKEQYASSVNKRNQSLNI